VGFGAIGEHHHAARHAWPAAPTVRHAKRWSVMRLPELAGLRCGDEALFTTGKAGMFGSDDTGPDSSLVGRRKEIPLLSPSGGTIGHDQRRERHAHRLVSTSAVARPYISPGRVTDQATGSTLTGVVVFVAEWSCTKRYVTAALAHLRGQLVAPAALGPDSGGGPGPLLLMPGPSRKQLSSPRRSLDIPVSRCVQEFGAQVLARGASAVPSRCTCIDCSPRWVNMCIMLCKLHDHDRRGR
jgi:hypothetical protein